MMRKVQDICYGMLQTVFPKMQQEARRAGKEAKEWVERFVSLCEQLSINVGGPDANPEGNL